MIVRIWRGATRSEDAEDYVAYLEETGAAEYRRTPGNEGVWMLRREVADRTEFLMLTLWRDIDAVKGFAGDDVETAVFYPEDDRFLVERDMTAEHWEVVRRDLP